MTRAHTSEIESAIVRFEDKLQRSANNGWVVEALQAAWSAIAITPIPQDDLVTGVFRVDHLRLALDAAVRGGNDTDTVAAIAGGLLGAAYPLNWCYSSAPGRIRNCRLDWQRESH